MAEKIQELKPEKERSYRYLDLVMALFVTVLITSNIASSAKIIDWGFSLFGVRLAFDGGTLLFPISYIFGDVLTEVYGYARSRRVIWAGFAAALLMALVLAVVGALPPAEGWENQAAYHAILGSTGRIVAASLVAYFAGSFSNAGVLARLKVLTRGRWLWARTIGSTLVGEGVDTALFVGLAFYGTLTPGPMPPPDEETA
jgi:uncharacterized integral membrane protein (TIGR00697 family)